MDRAANKSDFTSEVHFHLGPLDGVKDLKVVEQACDNTFSIPNPPKFEWNPPLLPPSPTNPTGGITDYKVRITRGGTPVIPAIPSSFVSFIDSAFLVECFTGTGDSIGTGVGCNEINFAGDTVYRMEVIAPLLDGTYVLEMRVEHITLGVATLGVPLEVTFNVDVTPPGAPGLVFPP